MVDVLPRLDQNAGKSAVYFGGLNMIDYSWVPWFEELATKIAEGGEDYLIERAKGVAWGDNPAILQYGDENIDPFSFLYFFTHKYRLRRPQRDQIFRSVQEKFGIGSDFPKTASIPVPTVNLLFHGGPTTFNPKVLWRLYRQAVRVGAEPAIQAGAFNAALAIRNVGIPKLTQTLFIANPRYFLPADDKILAVVPEYEDVNDYRGYVAAMDAVRHYFPGCHPYEINTFLTIQTGSDPLISKKPNFFQVSTNVDNDGTDYWKWNDEWSEEDYSRKKTFSENNYVYTGRPGENMTYPLAEPKRGDVILVRFRRREGRAIGVVERNEYDLEDWNEDGAIHAYWINKTSTEIEGNLPIFGFSKALETQTAFRNTDAYAPSFDLIDRWTREGDGEAPSASETPTKKPDTPFPLNTILFGPPGTGKTWEAVSWAVAIVGGSKPESSQPERRRDVKARYDQLRGEGRVELVTFHQSYAYEDFVEGIGPVLNKNELLYELREGIFKQISLRARKHPSQRFVLVIDEINRGNIARIFGELITLIEPSKRAGADDKAVVILPYSREPFSVPGNLYLVGTMNTADRGIALLDSALRRRFDFVEKMPNVQLVEEDIEGVRGQAMLQAINERITVYLDREHQIGHTYLIGVETIDRLAEAFQRRIVPLLQEYFYDDWAKIRSVLNGNPFIVAREVGVSIQDDQPERPVYELLPQADEKWTKAESYQQIYAGEQAEDQD